MLAYLDRVSLDQLEDARIVLFVLYAVATIGVVLGVYLEKETFVSRTKHFGWQLLIVSLASELFFAVTIFSIDSEISNRLRAALLEVRQQAAIRDITPDEMKEIASKLDKFSGQPAQIVVFPVNFESVWIAGKIYGILLDAHWSVPYPERLSAPPGNGFMVQGIFVDRSNDLVSKEAATALRGALNSTVARVSAASDNFPGRAFDPTKPLVWIFVGDKPTPLHSWVTP
jgi:hypothetical protein